MRVRPLPRPGRHPGVGITPTSRVLVLPRAAILAQRTPAGLSARMSPAPPAWGSQLPEPAPLPPPPTMAGNPRLRLRARQASSGPGTGGKAALHEHP